MSHLARVWLAGAQQEGALAGVPFGRLPWREVGTSAADPPGRSPGDGKRQARGSHVAGTRMEPVSASLMSDRSALQALEPGRGVDVFRCAA